MQHRILLWTVLLCALNPWVVQAGAPPPPSIVSVPLDPSEHAAPPSEDFMRQGAINPSTEVLKAEHAVSAGDSNVLPSVEAPPAPSYRTLGAAAAAGVNPMATSATRGAQSPVVPSRGFFQQRWVRVTLAGLGVLLLLAAAAALRERFSSEDTEE